MQTIVLNRPGELRLAETVRPPAPAAGEARVRVRRIGVCGTDYHAFAGRQPFFEYPRILGHELGVEVIAVGPGVTTVSPGDRCAVEPYLECGSCGACRRGKTNCCEKLQVLGVHCDGGMREEIVLPARKLHRSTTLSLDQLALVETLGIGAHAVQRAAIEPGDTALVIGAGPIGLSVIPFALAAGAQVTVMDVNPARLAFCQQHFPAIASLDARTATPETFRERNGDLPLVVLDATGNPASMRAAFNWPAPGGRLVFVGLFQGEVAFDDPQFHRRELTLLASRNATSADFQRILRLLENGQIDTSAWITHRASLRDAPSSIPQWTQPEARVVKAMLEL